VLKLQLRLRGKLYQY